MCEMEFRRVPEPDGDQISLIGGVFSPEITISVELLEQADRRFLDYGDGLIVFRCIEGVATYGVIGDSTVYGEAPSGRSVTAKLLQVQAHRAASAPTTTGEGGAG